MASVSGSQLSFNSPNKGDVNLILSDGKTVQGAIVAGDYNIEIFTVPTSPHVALAGVDGTAVIEGAVKISDNTVQAATLGAVEQLGTGAYTLIDDTDKDGANQHQAPQGEKIQLGTGAQTVIGSSGDTIIGGNAGSGKQVIDLTGRNHEVTAGSMTAIGGAGPLLIEAGSHDSITGGTGPTTVVGGRQHDHKGHPGDDQGNRGNSDHDNQADRGHPDDDNGKPGPGSNDLITQGQGAMTVDGVAASTITGSTLAGAGSLTITNLGSSSSVTGGAGNLTMMDFGKHESITGGSGLNVIEGDDHSGDNAITGGTGTVTGAGGHAANTLIVSDQGDTITGSTGSMSVDGGTGDANIRAGTGGTTIEGGSHDQISNLGKGTMLVDITSGDPGHHGSSSVMGSGSETIDLGAGHGVTTLRDVSVGGGKGAAAETTVAGFSTTTDTIASASSVDASGKFLGKSSMSGGSTVLTFLDGSQMTLIGIADVTKVKFTQ